jgi:hypothetical protein
MADPERTAEPSDQHVYHWIFIYKETFDFKSLCFYRDALNEALATANLDEDLSALLNLENQKASPAEAELRKVNRAIE